jgi:Peptidase MA superfamily
MTRRMLTIFLIQLLTLPFIAGIAHAQVESLHSNVEYNFGELVFFKAYVQSATPVKAAVLFFQAENDTRTNVGFAEVHDLGGGSFALGYIHHMSDYTLRPFSTVRYHWELTLEDGTTYVSESEWFNYLDDRFDWKTLQKKTPQDKILVVHWYQGDVQFAQNILDVADAGWQRVQDLLKMPMPGKLDIYVYTDPETMQTALNPGSANWVAGHADPDLGVILVALPEGPEQSLLVEQRVPHELMHILLYQYNPLGYPNLPTWLNEGLASNAELDPNPDYRIMLEDAAKKNSLIPLQNLCNSFPREAYNALLSYAEAASFVKYLHDSYGVSGLNALVQAYNNGLDCDRGAEQALGKSLVQLQRNWERDVLSQDVGMKAFLNMLPWIILLLAVLAAPLILALLRLRAQSTDPAVSQQSG